MLYKTKPVKQKIVDAIEVKIEGAPSFTYSDNGVAVTMEKAQFLNSFEPARKRPNRKKKAE